METPAGRLPYSTTADSASYYYDLAWRQIMDEGRYGQSEISYRKALNHDPNFALAKANLGRLTLDTTEQYALFDDLADDALSMVGDEGKVLRNYFLLIDFTIKRRTGGDTLFFNGDTLLFRDDLFPAIRDSLEFIVHRYPEEPYLKAEYIEFIAATAGPGVALDSLTAVTRHLHADNPFLVGFKAHLLAATGEHQAALATADYLNELVIDSLAPKVPAVYADVYLAMDSLQLAYQYARRAVDRDPRNLDASRLLSRIKARLEEEN